MSVEISKIKRNYLGKLIEDAYNEIAPNEEKVKNLLNKAKEIFVKEDKVKTVHAPVIIWGDILGHFLIYYIYLILIEHVLI